VIVSHYNVFGSGAPKLVCSF